MQHILLHKVGITNCRLQQRRNTHHMPVCNKYNISRSLCTYGWNCKRYIFALRWNIVHKFTCYKSLNEKIKSLILYSVSFVYNTSTEEKSNEISAFVTQMENQDINLTEGTSIYFIVLSISHIQNSLYKDIKTGNRFNWEWRLK